MRELWIRLGDAAYPVIIERDCFTTLEWDRYFPVLPTTGALVTNSTVAALYLDRVHAHLTRWIPRIAEVVLPDGEAYKSLSTVETIYHQFIEAGLDRKSVVFALGGGVITDLVGFAASTYLRGLSYYQVPTSLLAQVDSSVGGKTGVNLPEGKNLVGTFYQPTGVLIDPAFLETLPDREFREGLSEVAKAGFLAGGELFTLLRDTPHLLSERTGVKLTEAISLSIEYKRYVVEQDERDQGIRAVLNYGHTLGHALEVATGYGTLRHGEAVAIGMVGEALIGRQLGLVDDDFGEIQKTILQSLGLPVRSVIPVSRKEVIQALWQDKKKEGGQLKFSLVECPGKPLFGVNVEVSLVHDILPEITEVIEP